MMKNYSDEQRRQLDFLCQQVQKLETILQTIPKGDKAYAQQMRIYLATVKEIRALRSMVNDDGQTDELLAFAPAGDAL